MFDKNHISAFFLSLKVRYQVQKLQQRLILIPRWLQDATRGRCISSLLPCRLEVWEHGSENLQSQVTSVLVCKTHAEYRGHCGPFICD